MTATAPPIPKVQARRLWLRPLAVEDAPGLHEAFGDAEAMRFWDALPSRDIAETEERISESLAFGATWHAAWAVLARQFIGMVNYHARNVAHRRLALGWILVPQAWGQGYMAEALRALFPHLFETLRTHRIEAEIEPDNLRSARLAEKLGFRREALLRDRLWTAGEPRSTSMYALFHSEWDVPCP